MDEFADVPVLSADEIVCILGLGMLASGMLEGLLFMAVPVVRWAAQSLYSQWRLGSLNKSVAIRMRVPV